MRSIAYDSDRFEPPAPVVALRIAAPGSSRFVVFRALVDTGADCTLIPADAAAALGLPRVDVVRVEGIGGDAGRAVVHAASVTIGAATSLARVVAFQGEAIVGRDLLNRLIARLDGPALKASFSRR